MNPIPLARKCESVPRAGGRVTPSTPSESGEWFRPRGDVIADQVDRHPLHVGGGAELGPRRHGIEDVVENRRCAGNLEAIRHLVDVGPRDLRRASR